VDGTGLPPAPSTGIPDQHQRAKGPKKPPTRPDPRRPDIAPEPEWAKLPQPKLERRPTAESTSDPQPMVPSEHLPPGGVPASGHETATRETGRAAQESLRGSEGTVEETAAEAIPERIPVSTAPGDANRTRLTVLHKRYEADKAREMNKRAALRAVQLRDLAVEYFPKDDLARVKARHVFKPATDAQMAALRLMTYEELAIEARAVAAARARIDRKDAIEGDTALAASPLSRTVLTNLAQESLMEAVNINMQIYKEGVTSAAWFEGAHSTAGRFILLLAGIAGVVTTGFFDPTTPAMEALKKALKFLLHQIPPNAITPYVTGRLRMVTDVMENLRMEGGQTTAPSATEKSKEMGEVSRLMRECLDELGAALTTYERTVGPEKQAALLEAVDKFMAGYEVGNDEYKARIGFVRGHNYSKQYAVPVSMLGAAAPVVTLTVPVAGQIAGPVMLGVATVAQLAAGAADFHTDKHYKARATVKYQMLVEEKYRHLPADELTVDHMSEKSIRAAFKTASEGEIEFFREFILDRLAQLKSREVDIGKKLEAARQASLGGKVKAAVLHFKSLESLQASHRAQLEKAEKKYRRFEFEAALFETGLNGIEGRTLSAAQRDELVSQSQQVTDDKQAEISSQVAALRNKVEAARSGGVGSKVKAALRFKSPSALAEGYERQLGDAIAKSEAVKQQAEEVEQGLNGAAAPEDRPFTDLDFWKAIPEDSKIGMALDDRRHLRKAVQAARPHKAGESAQYVQRYGQTAAFLPVPWLLGGNIADGINTNDAFHEPVSADGSHGGAPSSADPGHAPAPDHHLPLQPPELTPGPLAGAAVPASLGAAAFAGGTGVAREIKADNKKTMSQVLRNYATTASTETAGAAKTVARAVRDTTRKVVVDKALDMGNDYKARKKEEYASPEEKATWTAQLGAVERDMRSTGRYRAQFLRKRDRALATAEALEHAVTAGAVGLKRQVFNAMPTRKKLTRKMDETIKALERDGVLDPNAPEAQGLQDNMAGMRAKLLGNDDIRTHVAQKQRRRIDKDYVPLEERVTTEETMGLLIEMENAFNRIGEAPPLMSFSELGAPRLPTVEELNLPSPQLPTFDELRPPSSEGDEDDGTA